MNPVNDNFAGDHNVASNLETLQGANHAPEAPLPLGQSEVASGAPELPSIGGPAPTMPSALTAADAALLANRTASPVAGAATSVATHSAAPAVADDADLIEKEWVLRAKALVAKTKDDPHEQNKELNLYKADYIKKRYNKDVKVSEG